MSRKGRRNKKFKFRYLLFILIPILAILLFVGAYFWKITNQIQKPKNTKKVVIQKNKDVVLEKDKDDESWDIALFGLDSRTKSLDKGNRSDVIMIAHIDGSTKKVSLSSVYRDSYVTIPDKGLDKITHAYAYGGYELALNTLNTNYDLEINKFVTVNFLALQDAIDLLGGVTIDVQPEEVKFVNGYVTSLNKECGINKVQLISGPGKQTLTGSEAVAYCRIRYTSGGDLKRSERQRTVLNAMLDKAKQTNVTTLLKIVNQMTDEIYTNLDTSEMLGLAKDVASYEIVKSDGFPYHTKTGSAMCYNANSPKNLSVVIPTNYLGDLDKLHKEVLGYSEYEPSSKVKEYAQTLAPYQQPVDDSKSKNESGN